MKGRYTEIQDNTVAFYLRYSCSNQREESLEAQESG